jgi:hypothetical protein
MYLQKKKYAQILKFNSMQKFRSIVHRSLGMKVAWALRLVKEGREWAVLKIQKYLRKWGAKREVERIRYERKRDKAAEIVGRHLQGYWHRRMINWLRQQIKAWIVVQKYWRGHKARKKVSKIKRKREKKMKREIREVEKRFRRQRKIEREVEGYIDNLFKNEMDKRTKGFKVKKQESKTIQNVQDEMIATGGTKKQKFINRNIQNAKKVIEQCDKNKVSI